ncbi:trehalose-6-phosphate synthase [bacterium SM23_31]|nr:MAG: trehalose-6-phosphate synthase [bacterium SM23_31]
MSRLLIVSNRLPVSAVKRGETLRIQPSAGGLATGMSSLLKKSYKGVWIGWPGIAVEKITVREKNEIKKYLDENNFYPVFLSQSYIEDYYSGFCNKTIWPLFHYFSENTIYDKNLWNIYNRVNKYFCDIIMKVVQPGDIVWIHDYHLMLLPQMLRKRCPNITIGFFLHIPFPSFEVFRLLPWRKNILEGLLGAELIGFHTYDYVRHFLDSVRNRLGYEHSLGQIIVGSRIVKVDTFPMGIDYDRFAHAVNDPDVKKEIEKNCKKLGDRKIILSIDRLDYTKGILQRLHSFDLFLNNHPEYREKVTLILVAVPSRTKVEQYRQLKRELDELISRINGKHGAIGWIPVCYLYCLLPFHSLTALYSISDVALITPIRDGMNLIAKEYIATKNDGKGVLILSEMAGAAQELCEAIIVNPNNIERIAESIHQALTMPVEDQIERNRTMQRRLQRYNVEKWAEDFIKTLYSVKKLEHELLAQKLNSQIREEIISNYCESKHRLILLDYDGTLTPFALKPEHAKPDKGILSLLQKLSRDSCNELVIISGRDKDTLEKWFGNLNISLSAEHGVWNKKKMGVWELSEPITNYWKDVIRLILELYMDRTPGSFIEEKSYSLAWHFRKSDPELASVRARELKESILHLTTNIGLSVLEGNKVIEIKNAGIHKGLAVLKRISHGKFDFILAAGDDWTDEDIFKVLPEHAYSIKVGLTPSKAKFKVDSVKETRELLKEMLEVTNG